jgi:hypothetical protein
MIAQKVVEAKQSQKPRRPAIAAPDLVASALGTPTSERFLHRLSLKSLSVAAWARQGFKLAAVSSYSNRFLARPWPSAWPDAPAATLFVWSLPQPQRRDRQ